MPKIRFKSSSSKKRTMVEGGKVEQTTKQFNCQEGLTYHRWTWMFLETVLLSRQVRQDLMTVYKIITEGRAQIYFITRLTKERGLISRLALVMDLCRTDSTLCFFP